MHHIFKCFSQLLEFLGRWTGVLLFGTLFTTTLWLRTTLMTGFFEWAEISSVPWYVYLAAICLLLFLLYLPRLLRRFQTKHLFLFFTTCYIVLGLLLIFTTSFVGRDDAGRVFQAAIQLNNGNHSFLEPGAYLFRYPHQLGLVTFERVILKLIPLPVISIFFVVNLFMVIGMNYATWKTTDELFERADISRFVIVLSFGFLPLFFNIMFAYGLMYGLFFASFACLEFVRYLKYRKIKHAILLLVFITLAYWVRNNNIILIIALAGMLVLYAMKEAYLKHLLLVLCLFAFPILASKGTTLYYEHLTHQKLPGTPQIAWLAMGVQEDEASKRLPGWYTGYVRDIYREKKGDIAKIEENADQLFTRRMLYFIQHPDEASWFFGIKYISSWTEGSFQSIWNGPSKVKKQPLWNPIAKEIYHDGTLHLPIITYMQGFLILLYFGGFAYYLLSYRHLGEGATIGLYAFLYLFGGILFHLISETKSQYTLPYLYLQFPMIAAGLEDLRKRVRCKGVRIHSRQGDADKTGGL